jgi:hypothetical protein
MQGRNIMQRLLAPVDGGDETNQTPVGIPFIKCCKGN